MGHQRLGRLPASKKWQEIVAYIVNGNDSITDLADAVFDACEGSFKKASKDPAFQKAIYLLCKIPIAGKSDNLKLALAELGIIVPDKPTRTDILAGFEKAIEQVQRANMRDITDLSEMAKHAGISALNTLLAKPEPIPQLEFWSKPIEGTHLALKQFATPEGFADLMQSFFASFGEINIRYFLDRELPKHLGTDGFTKSIPDMRLFDEANERHNKETSIIMRFFAKEWYAKLNYHEKKKLTPKEANGFVSVAINKIREEYRARNIKGAAV